MTFGELNQVEQWLKEQFDHTLLLNENDPELKTFEQLAIRGVCNLVVMPNVSLEGSSKYVFDYVNPLIKQATQDRAWVFKVETRENDKNMASYSRNAI